MPEQGIVRKMQPDVRESFPDIAYPLRTDSLEQEQIARSPARELLSRRDTCPFQCSVYPQVGEIQFKQCHGV